MYKFRKYSLDCKILGIFKVGHFPWKLTGIYGKFDKTEGWISTS